MIKEEKIFTNKYLVIVFAIISCMLWGSAFPFLKLSYKALAIGPNDVFKNILFASYRFFLAGVWLFLYLIIKKQSLKLERQFWFKVVLIAILQITVQYFLFYIGLANTTGIKGAIIQASGSFFTVILSHYIYVNDRVNLSKVIGLIFGFSGVVLVNINKAQGWDFDFKIIGEGFLMIAALVSAIASIVAKDVTNKVSPVLMTAYQMIIGSLVLFVLASFNVKPNVLEFNTYSFSIFIYLSFLSAGAFALWYNIVKYNQLGKLAIYRFLIPVFGVFFSALLLPEESLSLNVILALILVGFGIVSVNFSKLTRRKYEENN